MKRPRSTAPAISLLLGIAILGLIVAGLQTGRGFGPSVARFIVPAHAPVRAVEIPGPTATLVINDFDYSPASLTIPAGTTVDVDDRDGVIHTITALDGSFDTGEIAAHQRGMFTAPARPSRFTYRDTVLPFMTGTLVVIIRT